MISNIFTDFFLDEYKQLKNNIDEIIININCKKKIVKKISNDIKDLEKDCIDEMKRNLDELIQNDEKLIEKVNKYVKYIKTVYVLKKENIVLKKNEKNAEFKKLRQFNQKEIINRNNIDKLLCKYNIYDKLKCYINEMFKKWGGHQEDVFCIVCNEYFKIPYKINISCKCIYNVCYTCVTKHKLSLHDTNKQFRCIICTEQVPPTLSSSQYFYINEHLLQNINNVIVNTCNDIKKKIDLDIKLIDCFACKKKFKDLKDIVSHDCSK
jgi:hypothetical protein